MNKLTLNRGINHIEGFAYPIILVEMGIAMPQVLLSQYLVSGGVFSGSSINFGDGTEGPAIVIYDILCNRLTEEELLGVLLHEEGHLKSNHFNGEAKLAKANVGGVEVLVNDSIAQEIEADRYVVGKLDKATFFSSVEKIIKGIAKDRYLLKRYGSMSVLLGMTLGKKDQRLISLAENLAFFCFRLTKQYRMRTKAFGM